MQKQLYIVIILLSIWCTSCKQQEAAPNFVPIATNNTLTPIITDVKMVKINGGEYKPFYGSNTALVKVAPFLVDERQVTNSEFLAFVKVNPQWRRSQVKRLYADTTYLHNWQNDTTLPKDAKPDAPITYVSWFAAKAYANAAGKRLPTLDEWEFVAMADDSVPNARNKKSYSNAILNLYLEKDRQYNAVKQSPPNYWGVYNVFDLVWEWTDDFNSVLASGDSRAGEYGDKNLVCAAGATSATDVMNYAAFMRFGFRSSLKATYTVSNLGFRCAKDIAAKE
ncbi:MAG TPA: formylglycine-generating enzyme family protein [Chitinophagales bacterium]|nr:formylglycine-generating enzyme family protein [Chitinophagales bacterium]HNM32605.1 formylglycine-generating enzyme family protein [Chitinophagales bacterium]